MAERGMADAPIVEVDDLAKSYRTPNGAIAVLRGLSLTVARGEMVAIIGASGVGKSTLLHVLGGLDRAERGAVRVAGADIAAMTDDDLVAFRNRHVGFVFQFHHLLPEFTALENVMMPLRIARRPAAEARPRAEALLDRVGLAGRLTHVPGMLSGGEQQRVADGPRAGDGAGAPASPTSPPATSTSTPPRRCTASCARCTATPG